MKPLLFINEPIEVMHDQPPMLEKKPGPPSAFSWRGEKFMVAEVLSEWHDYRRRGRMARNMQPTHARTAESRGSWGVGQDYYQIRTEGRRIFELYFDRAPADSDHRKGGWYLYRELEESG